MSDLTGTVEKVDFTLGSAGNQWTTIGGKRYATWWNFNSKDWKVGDIVKFRHYRAPLWSGQADIDCADRIRKATPSVPSPTLPPTPDQSS